MFDDSSVSQSPLDIKIVYKGDSLLVLNFRPNMVGMWNLKTSSSSIQEVVVTASCTHNFISDFKVLDVNTTHPNLRTLQGKPIASEFLKIGLLHWVGLSSLLKSSITPSLDFRPNSCMNYELVSFGKLSCFGNWKDLSPPLNSASTLIHPLLDL